MRGRPLAVVAEPHDELSDATRRYADAANGCEAFGSVLERGQCLAGARAMPAGPGRAEEGTAALRAARAVLEPLGTASVLDEIDALLGR